MSKINRTVNSEKEREQWHILKARTAVIVESGSQSWFYQFAKEVSERPMGHYFLGKETRQ